MPGRQATPAQPATPPPPPPAAARTPTSDKPIGVTPSEPKAAEKPVQEPPKPAEPKAAEKPVQETPKEPPKPAEPTQEASAPPKPELEAVEKKLPEVAPPPAPLTMQDFVKIAPPPAPHQIAKAVPHPPAAPPPQQHQQLQHSPLSSQQHRSPEVATAPNNTFVNPAPNYSRARIMDEYQWAVIRKFSQYLPNLREKNEGGTVTLRFTIARNGRLLDAAISQSSGVMALDKGMLDAIRAASPYPPLPSEFQGDRATFTQPITAKR
jgi:TonB family protein